MRKIELQTDEAEALEALLDLLLTNTAASAAVFATADQRRSVKRVSMKLHWARNKELANDKPA